MHSIRSIFIFLLFATITPQYTRATQFGQKCKKTARIALHAGQTAAGLYIAYTALAAYRVWPSYRADLPNRPDDSPLTIEMRRHKNNIRRLIREKYVPRMAAGCAVSIPTLLYHGITGLSKEFSLSLPSWIPSLPTSTKKSLEPLRKIIKIAVHCAQLGAATACVLAYQIEDNCKTARNFGIITDFGSLDYAMTEWNNWARHYEGVAMERLSDGSKITIPLQVFVTSQLAWYGAKGLKQELSSLYQLVKAKLTTQQKTNTVNTVH